MPVVFFPEAWLMFSGQSHLSDGHQFPVCEKRRVRQGGGMLQPQDSQIWLDFEDDDLVPCPEPARKRASSMPPSKACEVPPREVPSTGASLSQALSGRWSALRPRSWSPVRRGRSCDPGPRPVEMEPGGTCSTDNPCQSCPSSPSLRTREVLITLDLEDPSEDLQQKIDDEQLSSPLRASSARKKQVFEGLMPVCPSSSSSSRRKWTDRKGTAKRFTAGMSRGADPVGRKPPSEVQPLDASSSPPSTCCVLPDCQLLELLLSSYVRKGPGSRPCSFVLAVLALTALVAGLGVALLPPEIETDFGAFVKTDVNTSSLRDTFLDALQQRSEGRRLDGLPRNLYNGFEISLAYELKDQGSAGNILEPAVLSRIVELERQLITSAAWREHCNSTAEQYRPQCETGASFASYLLPKAFVQKGEVVPWKLTFDGKGVDQLPVPAVLQLIDTRDLAGIVLPTGFDRTKPAAMHLRSVFRFYYLCCTSVDTNSFRRSRNQELRADWDQFMKQDLLPSLQKMAHELQESQGSPIRLYFDGDGVNNLEVMQTLLGDLGLAAGSLLFVLLYVALHTGSLILSLVGMLVVCLAVPLAYLASAVLTGSRTMTVASFLSLFLVVGLGSDVMFVYFDFWRASAKFNEDINERMIWTYKKAGKASLATTATTAVSFFANLASVLKPLREFGFFMGLCVMVAWALLSAIVVPLCFVDERHCSACRLRCRRKGRSQDVPSGPGSGNNNNNSSQEWQKELAQKWTLQVFRWRRTGVLLWLLAVLVAITCTGTSLRVSTGVPNIFPAEHNQNHGKEVMQEFKSLKDVFKFLDALPSQSVQVCDMSGFPETSCPLFWCEAKSKPAGYSSQQCQCFRRKSTGTRTCEQDQGAPTATLRLFHSESLDVRSLTGLAAKVLANGTGFPQPSTASVSAARKVPLLLQEWETGATGFQATTDFSAVLADDGSSPQACGVEQVCFCGGFACSRPSGSRDVAWIEAPVLWLPSTDSSFGRQLEAAPPGASLVVSAASRWEIASHQRATVDVVFGITATPTSALLGQVDLSASWHFSGDFQARQPWAQRKLLAFCTGLQTPAASELRVAGQRCWIEVFRDHLQAKGMRFPARPEEFDAEIASFSQQTEVSLSPSKNFLWLRGDEMKASFFSFDIDVHRFAPSDTALEHMHRWDDYIHSWETSSAGESRFVKGTWH
ncbi:unnamed protein product, partial [Polarella glacialis]